MLYLLLYRKIFSAPVCTSLDWSIDQPIPFHKSFPRLCAHPLNSAHFLFKIFFPRLCDHPLNPAYFLFRIFSAPVCTSLDGVQLIRFRESFPCPVSLTSLPRILESVFALFWRQRKLDQKTCENLDVPSWRPHTRAGRGRPVFGDPSVKKTGIYRLKHGDW